MKISLFKYNFISKTFATTLKINKYKNVSENLRLSAPKVPDDYIQDETHGVDKTPPKEGEIYHLPTINSKLIALEQGYTKAFDRDPVSSYYSMKVKDVNYHVFNAARITLGRMCAKIAYIIQGKASPHYRPNKIDYRDKCVIVNASHVWLTGKKLEQKLYYHHTGYPGGLKQIKARHYLEKKPEEMISRSIKGMLPKNKMRLLWLSKVLMFREGGHNLHSKGLPQFAKINPLDYNELFGVNDLLRGQGKIVHSTVPKDKLPEMFKNLEYEEDESLSKPAYMTTPETTVNTRMKTKFDTYMRRNRYRQYRHIRNKAYRYM